MCSCNVTGVDWIATYDELAHYGEGWRYKQPFYGLPIESLFQLEKSKPVSRTLVLDVTLACCMTSPGLGCDRHNTCAPTPVAVVERQGFISACYGVVFGCCSMRPQRLSVWIQLVCCCMVVPFGA